MRVIFVPVADRPECANALRTAFDLGHRLGASIQGCHIRPHRSSDVKLPSELRQFTGNDIAWEATWKDKKTRNSSSAAKMLFGKVAEAHGFPLIKKPRATPGAVWLEKLGSPEKVLSIMGPISDLITVSRPKTKDSNTARLFMMAALLNSSRPVLILPQTRHATIGKRISIAWNQSPEAALAVSAAMPLLQQAERVSIITNGSEGGAAPKATELAAYLGFWGVKAERVTSREKDDVKAIRKAYNESQSDLLVMGAYSRSRLRQQIFGGVTEFMVQHTDIPVFMLHT